jgi:hypothetical protein
LLELVDLEPLSNMLINTKIGTKHVHISGTNYFVGEHDFVVNILGFSYILMELISINFLKVNNKYKNIIPL